jgi:outer membrane protein assembly factor BamD (BamD/ComL family)
VAALSALPGIGCQSIGTNPLALWRQGLDSSLSKAPTRAETGDNRNFMARWLTPKKPPAGNFDPNPLVLGSDGWRPMKAEVNPEADKEFREAEALFQQGKLDLAEKAFAKLAKKRKGTPWGEKGQYYLAETQFQRGKLVPAEDSYELLMKDYPGTEFVEKVTKREYAIAQTWLAQYDPKAPPEKKLPWHARFDGQEPLIDPHGYALRALEHVRHHSPQGELADDAVLRIADEHMIQKDYESAAVYYDQLITDHPKSPFSQRAHLAAIDARMKAYVGPEYDGAGLEKARELVKQTMATFPDRQAGTETLYHTLDLINDQEAERTYTHGAYYKRTGKVLSAEYYFGMIPQRWPKSPWAAKAKTELASLAKMPRKQSLPSKIMTQPGSTDPMLNGGMGGMGGGMGGMGMGGMGGMGGMN